MAKSKSKTIFNCQNCGAQFAKWQGRCTECSEWNTVIEEMQTSKAGERGWSIGSTDKARPSSVKLDTEIVEIKTARASTGFVEVDRVLGGGLVKGSYILLGGDPGIGKSTLLMQLAGGLAKQNNRVLYISAEESVQQTGLRAQRLGVRSGNVEVGSESNLENILNLAQNKKPDVLIIDSVQSIYLPTISSAPGTVSQVRECAGQLMGLAKEHDISVFLIGHVTKDGNIAGPKTLEHMVDTVLSFEGDSSHHFRLLRSLKNRFGATHQLGVFQMSAKGLEEVLNPSELFLEERGNNLVGSVVFCSMEGTRPLLCEVQALTTPSPMAMPRRTSVGVDAHKIHLLVAVLDKHLNTSLANHDVFVNVVGGLKLDEPATDLAISAALISSIANQNVDSKTCFFGEIGLTGEVRAVSYCESRIQEALKLGFESFVIPASNKKHLGQMDSKILQKVTWIRNVKDLLTLFEVPGRKNRKVFVDNKTNSQNQNIDQDMES